MAMTASEREIPPLRITLLRPPAGVAFAVQRGRHELLPPTRRSADETAFGFTVRVGTRADGALNLLGPFAQGTLANRFVYVSSGTSAGQSNSRWSRRTKVKTAGITWAMVEAVLATPGAVLEARIRGTSGDGGPCCATVPLLDHGWRVVRGDRGHRPASPRGRNGIGGV
jgi:hypothetical protein